MAVHRAALMAAAITLPMWLRIFFDGEDLHLALGWSADVFVAAYVAVSIVSAFVDFMAPHEPVETPADPNASWQPPQK